MSKEKGTNTKIIQPAHLCKLLGTKHIKEAERVLSLAYAFLVYMNPGDSLETSDIRLSKISKDLIHVDSDFDLSQVVDGLEKKRVLCIPL
jgi:hypothetical protein